MPTVPSYKLATQAMSVKQFFWSHLFTIPLWHWRVHMVSNPVCQSVRCGKCIASDHHIFPVFFGALPLIGVTGRWLPGPCGNFFLSAGFRIYTQSTHNNQACLTVTIMTRGDCDREKDCDRDRYDTLWLSLRQQQRLGLRQRQRLWHRDRDSDW